MRAIFILTFLLFSMTSLASNQKYNLDSIFSVTDQIIKNANLYVQQKEENIKRKKAELTNAKTDGERFMLNRQLYTLYKKYNAKKALQYCSACKQLAIKNNRKDWLTISYINTMREAVVRGDLMMAKDVIAKIGPIDSIPKDLRTEYVIGILHFDNQMRHKYTSPTIYKEMTHGLPTINGHIADYISKNNIYYNIAIGFSKKYSEVNYPLLKEACDKQMTTDVGAGMFDYAMAHYLLTKKDSIGYQFYLAKAIINDVKSVNLKSQALLEILNCDYVKRSSKRSYLYAQFCANNTTRFSFNTHSSSVLKINETVVSIYVKKVEQQQQILLGFIIIMILALFCITFLFLLHRKEATRLKKLSSKQNQHLAEINRITAKLKENNAQLRDEIKLRDNNFLNTYYLCSSFLKNYNDLKRELTNLLVTHSYKKALELASSTEVSEETQKEFYKRFDAAFLSTHPDFIKRFNCLLKEEERFETANITELNIGLRIYALISLGINNSIQIADFLQYSTQTIYNRRLKMRRNACIDEKYFAEAVLNIYDDEQLAYYLKEHKV